MGRYRSSQVFLNVAYYLLICFVADFRPLVIGGFFKLIVSLVLACLLAFVVVHSANICRLLTACLHALPVSLLPAGRRSAMGRAVADDYRSSKWTKSLSALSASPTYSLVVAPLDLKRMPSFVRRCLLAVFPLDRIRLLSLERDGVSMSTSEFAGREALTNTAHEIPESEYTRRLSERQWQLACIRVLHQRLWTYLIAAALGWLRCRLGGPFIAPGFRVLDSAAFGSRSVHHPVAYEERART